MLQNERYTTHMDLQMQQATALTFYNAQHAYNQAVGADAQNVVNWHEVQEVQQKMATLAYNPAFEDNRQRFLADSLQRASKDLLCMQKAVGAVFEWILSTVESSLGTRVIELQARNGAGYNPHTNLADAIAMLTKEMAGNPAGSRETCWEMMAGIKPATTVVGFRFVLDTMCSIWTVISSSIALHGGNGLPTPSQMHHKLMTKMDKNAAQLTYLRFRLQNIAATTPILSIRDQLKEDLDREGSDGRQLTRTMSGGSIRQTMYATPNAANAASLEAMIEHYNLDATGQRGEADQGGGYQAWLAHGGGGKHPGGTPMQGNYGRPNGGGSSTNRGGTEGRKAVCTNYLYDGCTRPDCKFGHPPLKELKNLIKMSQEGGAPISSAPQAQRKPSPLKGGILKRPSTPIRLPPSKKLSYANAANYEGQDEHSETGEEREEGAYEGDEEDLDR